jgi:hypothetical protein
LLVKQLLLNKQLPGLRQPVDLWKRQLKHIKTFQMLAVGSVIGTLITLERKVSLQGGRMTVLRSKDETEKVQRDPKDPRAKVNTDI